MSCLNSGPFITIEGLFLLLESFLKYIFDICLRKWKRKCHKLTDSKYIHHSLFTNDQVIIAEYEDVAYIFFKLRNNLDEW